MRKKANVLGIQFSKVFTKEHKSECDHVSVELSCPVTIQFNKESILAKLAAFNTYKSPGQDGFHPRILYEIRQELVEPLEILFATSLKSSTLPMDWRSANITAIYKKGSKKDPSNYRPISLTCIICKIMESVIRDFIVDYFVSNGFF